MKRVLQIVKGMDRGGLENFIMNVYRNLDFSELQYDFLVEIDHEGAFDEEIQQLGGNIYHITSRKKNYLQNRKDLKNFFIKHGDNYDVVQMHLSSWRYLTPLKYAKKYSKSKIIAHGHNSRQSGNKVSLINHYFYKYLGIKYFDILFVVSDKVCTWLLPPWQRASSKVVRLSNGIDLDRFGFYPSKRMKIREKYNLNNNIVIGNVARFVPVKNHEYLLCILDEMIKSGYNTTLLLVGEGPKLNEIKEKTVQMGLERFVIFTGLVDNVQEYVQAMDVFVMPSFFEGFPVALVEAQASGLGCVISDTISSEVALTNNVAFLNLDDSIQNWTKKVVEFSEKNREKSFMSMKDSEYNVVNTIEKLKKYY